MIAIDTNVLVRFLVADDPGQADRAKALIQSNCIFIPKTVLLETEWVLRRAYGFSPQAIKMAYRKLLGLDHIVVEAPLTMKLALDWYAQGMDFADALHLAGSRFNEAFVTFDRALRSKAGRIDQTPAVREP